MAFPPLLSVLTRVRSVVCARGLPALHIKHDFVRRLGRPILEAGTIERCLAAMEEVCLSELEPSYTVCVCCNCILYIVYLNHHRETTEEKSSYECGVVSSGHVGRGQHERVGCVQQQQPPPPRPGRWRPRRVGCVAGRGARRLYAVPSHLRCILSGHRRESSPAGGLPGLSTVTLSPTFGQWHVETYPVSSTPPPLLLCSWLDRCGLGDYLGTMEPQRLLMVTAVVAGMAFALVGSKNAAR
jgi:hypothetical protein